AETSNNLADAEDHIGHVVGTFLARIWGWWYEQARFQQEIIVELREFLIANLAKADGRMFRFVNDMSAFDNRHYNEILGVLGQPTTQWPSPKAIWEAVINEAGHLSVTSGIAVVHGDAHGDNIFFDTQSRDVWVIDFARTDERVSIFDFAF